MLNPAIFFGDITQFPNIAPPNLHLTGGLLVKQVKLRSILVWQFFYSSNVDCVVLLIWSIFPSWPSKTNWFPAYSNSIMIPRIKILTVILLSVVSGLHISSEPLWNVQGFETLFEFLISCTSLCFHTLFVWKHLLYLVMKMSMYIFIHAVYCWRFTTPGWSRGWPFYTGPVGFVCVCELPS